VKNPSIIREATADDVSAMFDIRTSVLENTATKQQLYAHGIDDAFVTAAIMIVGRGWMAEDAGSTVGFCIADPQKRVILALFVRPEFERRGHGGKLLDTAVEWLFSQSSNRVTLTTGPNTRAHRFYLRRGWIETAQVEPNGDIELELPFPSLRLR